MPSDPTTAAELQALVAQWPEEARPKGLYYSPSRSGEADFFYLSKQQNYAGPCILPTTHAIDLHIVSGIEHYCRVCRYCPQVYNSSTGHRCFAGKCAPTLFLALHAAVMSTKEKA